MWRSENSCKAFELGTFAGADEGQIKYLDDREAASCVRGQGPYNIHDTVARLVEELLRAAAKLHRRKDIDLDPALRFRLDLARPGRDEFGRYIAIPRQEVMKFQREFSILPEARSGHPWQSQGAAHANQNTSTRTTHVFPQDAKKLILVSQRMILQ
jgi:hypothetical protein